MKGRNFNKNGDTLKNDPQAKHTITPKPNEKRSGNRKVLKSQKLNEALEKASKQKPPKRLFGQLWWEKELAVVFATTNVGKTILGMQIAEALASGSNVFQENTVFENECDPMKVLYLDYELSLSQIVNRYTELNGENLYRFDDNLIRLEKNFEFEFKKGDSVEEFISEDIQSYIEEHKPQALIIDNLSVLRSGTESAKEALPLMHMLNNLKGKHGISILVVGHTPKKDAFTPINITHLQGSAQISNALDGCFAIAMCKDNERRYIIELKQRNVAYLAHADNVIVCDVRKDINFLQFHFIGFDYELNLLKQLTKEEEEAIVEKIMKLKKQGKTFREIANDVPYRKSKVNKIYNENKDTWTQKDPVSTADSQDNMDNMDNVDKPKNLSMTSAVSTQSTVDGQSAEKIPF